RPDGNIEFLGRLDHQVKLRGFRVELGEIESVLRASEGVKEAAVVVDEREGEKRLIGYVVPEMEGALLLEQLRAQLREQLPEYMVPSVFMELEKLPLTASGKVDRRALPTPGQERADGGMAYVAPRTIVEEVLVGLWEDVLGVKPVGVYDNFFELGGHSLLATQLMSRVRQSFAVEVALRSLFDGPTIAELGEKVEQERGNERGGSRAAVTRVSRTERLPLSYAQQRLWFLDQMAPGSAIYNVPLALRVSGELAVEVLEASLREVVRRHEVLRTRFVLRDGEAEQVIDEQVEFKLGLEDLSVMEQAAAEGVVQEQARAEAQLGFDLSTGPLLRAKLLRLSESEHVLLLTMHHIVSDGWSLGVLVKELGQLYQAYAQGERAALAELEVQYADYAVWQREYLQGEVLEQQLSYWREQLAGAAPVLELPTDRPRPQFQTFNGSVLTFDLPVELSNKLMALSRHEGATLFMTLFSAFAMVLQRQTGQEDIVVGTSIANRNRQETEHLLGCFINQLALRINVAGNPTFRELLRRVRECCLQAYAHQDVPFEKLLETLKPERNPGYFPIFQVMFILQNAAGTTLEIPGLKLSPLETQTTVTRVDLALMMEEAPHGLKGVLEYNTDLFDPLTIVRLKELLEATLEGIVKDPDQDLQIIGTSKDSEPHELVHAFNDDLIG
ncbi:MAG TPA: condensation domain-containing protein, partial [Pyrinomonadaceae bacterium]